MTVTTRGNKQKKFTYLQMSRLTIFLSNKSIKRPVVATIICTPLNQHCTSRGKNWTVCVVLSLLSGNREGLRQTRGGRGWFYRRNWQGTGLLTSKKKVKGFDQSVVNVNTREEEPSFFFNLQPTFEAIIKGKCRVLELQITEMDNSRWWRLGCLVVMQNVSLDQKWFLET